MKMKILITMILLPMVLFAQFNNSVDFVLGTSYDYRYINAADNSHDFIIESRKSELGGIGYKIGMNYNRKLNRHFYLKTGLRFVKTGYCSKEILGDNFQWGSQHSGNGTFDTTKPKDPLLDDINKLQFHYNYYFVEIPLMIRYEITSNKMFKPFFELGVSPSYLVKAGTKQVTNIDKKWSDSSGGENKFQLTASLSLGTNYTLSQVYDLFIQVYGRANLTKLYDKPIQEYLISLGLEIGVRKKF